MKITGGYLKPYENVLFYHELDQKKSIVAIKAVVPFFKVCLSNSGSHSLLVRATPPQWGF